MDKKVLKMKLSRETKGTYVFEPESTGEPPVVSTLYIAKWAFTDKPKAITVTLE